MGIIEDSWYRNAGYPVAVVASVSYLPPDLSPEHPGRPGEVSGWAAYIGPGADKLESREETEAYVQKHGCKLPEAVARAFFPQFGPVPYRP